MLCGGVILLARGELSWGLELTRFKNKIECLECADFDVTCDYTI